MRPPFYDEPVRISRRAGVAIALVPLGTVAGHAAGYLLAGRHASFAGDHVHLRPTSWLAVLGAVAALGWATVDRAGTGRNRPRLVALAGAQAGLFVGLEAVEHLTAGRGVGRLLSEPSVRWGLAAQVATAAALVLATVVARASGERVRALLSSRPPAGRTDTPTPAPAASPTLRDLLPGSPASERGPPAPRLVPA